MASTFLAATSPGTDYLQKFDIPIRAARSTTDSHTYSALRQEAEAPILTNSIQTQSQSNITNRSLHNSNRSSPIYSQSNHQKIPDNLQLEGFQGPVDSEKSRLSLSYQAKYRSSNIFLQPDVTEDQLINEIRVIYTCLVKVEKAYIDIDKQETENPDELIHMQ
jgi:hypothetical protein